MSDQKTKLEKFLRLFYFSSIASFFGFIGVHVLGAVVAYQIYGVHHEDHSPILLEYAVLYGLFGQLVSGIFLWKYDKRLSNFALIGCVFCMIFMLGMVKVC